MPSSAEGQDQSDEVPQRNAGEAEAEGGRVSPASIGASDASASGGKKTVEDAGGAGDVGGNDTSPVTAASANQAKNDPKPAKIKVHLVAAGSAPILKKSKFLMNSDDRFVVAMDFLRRMLKLPTGGAGATAAASSSLFLYVNAAFVPSPDERIGDLFDCFGVGGELQLHYSLQEAWG